MTGPKTIMAVKITPIIENCGFPLSIILQGKKL